MIDVAIEKLRTASSRNEIERLERECKKLYGIEKGKFLNLFNQEIPKTKSKDVNVPVVYAIKGTMSILCLLLFFHNILSNFDQIGRWIMHQLFSAEVVLSFTKESYM